MNFIDSIKKRVEGNVKTIVLPEAEDLRTLQATALIEKEGFAKIILVGNKENILTMAKENGIVINSQIIDPETFSDTEKLINEFYELRKHKGMSITEAHDIVMNSKLYFGCMLVKMGYADGQVSGAIHSTADTLRPALQILKTAPGIKVASSFFLMDFPNCQYGDNGLFVFSDCGMIQNPTSEELVEIANSAAHTFKLLIGDEPIIAFLSYSTLGSAKHPDVDKVANAVALTKNIYPELNCDGEMQLDAAIVPEVAKNKAPNSKVAGHANVLIFPNLDAGNIGYKLAERFGHASAFGPVTQGLSKPVNDLSRGCKAEDIVGVVAITALQAK